MPYIPACTGEHTFVPASIGEHMPARIGEHTFMPACIGEPCIGERTFMPACIGESPANGTLLVASSHKIMAKLYMSAARLS